MDAKQGKTEAGEERKAVRELISISFETMRQEDSLQAESASLGLDGWISTRQPSHRIPPIQPLPRKARYTSRHNRCLSARRTPSLPSESSARTLDPPSELLEMTVAEEHTVREARVVQPFGSSSGNVPIARDFMKQFPPRRPRRDLRMSAYVAYSLVKQATELKLASERRLSQPTRSKETLQSARPPRPEAVRKERQWAAPVEITPMHREEKENKAVSSERVVTSTTDRVFTNNVKRYLQTSAEEQTSQRQQQTRRLNTALALAKFSL